MILKTIMGVSFIHVSTVRWKVCNDFYKVWF